MEQLAHTATSMLYCTYKCKLFLYLSVSFLSLGVSGMVGDVFNQTDGWHELACESWGDGSWHRNGHCDNANPLPSNQRLSCRPTAQ